MPEQKYIIAINEAFNRLDSIDRGSLNFDSEKFKQQSIFSLYFTTKVADALKSKVEQLHNTCCNNNKCYQNDHCKLNNIQFDPNLSILWHGITRYAELAHNSELKSNSVSATHANNASINKDITNVWHLKARQAPKDDFDLLRQFNQNRKPITIEACDNS